MSTGPHIRYLKRQEIDTGRWDRCIRQAPNGWIYMQSFFLDGISGRRWDALVASSPDSGDYEYVLPLLKKRKYGLWYTYVSPFVGQSGLIGRQPIPPVLIDHFLSHIPSTFRLVDILLNEQNPPPSLPQIQVTHRTNYVLPLRTDYANLCERYTADAKKNLRRTGNAGLFPEGDIPVSTVIGLYRAAYKNKNRFFSSGDYQRIAALCESCISRGHGFTLGIRDQQHHLHAAGFFAIDDKRIYYLLGAPSPEGRKSNAVHALIDAVIRQYAGKELEFDFEGSDIPSVAAFYRKFSPEARQYCQVKLNRLPRWLQRLA